MVDCRRFVDLGITSARKPANTHLWVVTTAGYIYIVDSVDPTKIYKSEDKCATWTEIDDRFFNIQALLLDEPNNKLYYICKGGTDVDVRVLTLSNDNTTRYDDFPVNSAFALDLLNGADLFLANSGTLYALVSYEDTNTPSQYFTEVFIDNAGNFVYEDGARDFVLSTKDISYTVVIDDDDVYFIREETNGPLVFLSKFVASTSTYTEEHKALGALLMSDSESQQGIAYDGSDNLLFILKVGGVDKLYNYNITGNALTQIGTYDIALMLDRNNIGTAPNELEKAFGIADKIIYEIKPKRGGVNQLQDLSSQLSGNIICINDRFLLAEDNGTWDVYEWINVAIEMSNLVYTGGIVPIPKLGSFQVHDTLKDKWSVKDSFKYYDDNDVLEIWAKITEEYVDLFNNYHYDFDFFSNEMYRTPYNKVYTADNTGEKQIDMIDNALDFCYQSSSIVATATDWSYTYTRNTAYLMDLGRFLERQVPYIEPDCKTWTKAHDGLGKNAQYYPGTENFKEDVIGSFPSGWSDNDGVDCETTIITSFDNHRKVMQLDDQGVGAANRCQAHVSITQGLNTEIEFWLTKDSVAANTIGRVYIREASDILVYLQWDNDDLDYYDGAYKSIKDNFLVANTLTHFRIILDDTANTFDCYINGDLEGNNLAYLNNSTSGADEFIIVTGDNDTGYKCYLDALGISTDPTYIIGDNVVAWTLNDGNQNVQMIDIPRLALDRGGYFSGSLGVTRATVRYKDNTTSTKPTIPASGKTAAELLTGIIELKEFRDSKVEDSPEADQLATNRYDIFTSTIQFIGLRVEGEGFLQEGKTVYLENTGQITITAGHFVILRYRRWPLQDVTNMVVSDNIIFPFEFSSFGDTTRLQVHSANLQSFENQADIIAHLTREGGLAVRLINETGAVSVKGSLVEPHTNDRSFELTDGDCTECFGAVYEDGIAEGAECLVVFGGRVQVLLKDATASTTKNWVKTSDVAGRADATGASPAAAPQHFQEVGHCIETKAADTDVLAYIMMHFL